MSDLLYFPKFPKRTKEKEDPDYVEFIKTKPCIIGRCCKGDVVPHHIKSRRTCSDRDTVPVCWEHHNGNNSYHALGSYRAFDKHWGTDTLQKVKELNTEYDDCA